ncbi:hypothetical protein K469DRAFT_749914 [Zopfia rhizophila CBS 207.26]|uniref:Heterokaryon incompatibility domain-containing protein n=1 Tax=Zopfia rhizophila CBS 207.26 TaxID=1314779 RepID=A0A6A6E6W8_9PEZI|nr:hypothetical protein K469DRAFT_749914 [Zopfia rhizophila CBS 207.26]
MEAMRDEAVEIAIESLEGSMTQKWIDFETIDWRGSELLASNQNDMCLGKQLFRLKCEFAAICDSSSSSSGKIGLCPADTNPGDLIVLPSGAECPFIVRENQVAERKLKPSLGIPTYELVGLYYLDELMNGEVFDDPLFSDPLNTETLRPNRSHKDSPFPPSRRLNSWSTRYRLVVRIHQLSHPPRRSSFYFKTGSDKQKRFRAFKNHLVKLLPQPTTTGDGIDEIVNASHATDKQKFDCRIPRRISKPTRSTQCYAGESG